MTSLNAPQSELTGEVNVRMVTLEKLITSLLTINANEYQQLYQVRRVN